MIIFNFFDFNIFRLIRFFFFGNLLILILELLISSLSLILKIKIYQACDKKDKEDRWNWWNRWLIDFCVYNSFDNIVLSAIRLIFLSIYKIIYSMFRKVSVCFDKNTRIAIYSYFYKFMKWFDQFNISKNNIANRIYIYFLKSKVLLFQKIVFNFVSSLMISKRCCYLSNLLNIQL